MPVLIIGLVVFLGIHSVSIVAPHWRSATIARVGEKTWKGLYSLAAGVGLALVIVGFGLARRDPVVFYSPPAALRHFSLLLMVPVFPLLLATYFPGRISAAAKHPTLVAVKLWAVAHLLANGTLAEPRDRRRAPSGRDDRDAVDAQEDQQADDEHEHGPIVAWNASVAATRRYAFGCASGSGAAGRMCGLTTSQAVTPMLIMASDVAARAIAECMTSGATRPATRPFAVLPTKACSDDAMPRRSGRRSRTIKVTTGTIVAQPNA